jgi:leucyl aminopeptidase
MTIKVESSFNKANLKGFTVVFLYKADLGKWSAELEGESFSCDFKEELYLSKEKSQILFVGLGVEKELTLKKLSQVFASVAKKIAKLKKNKAFFVLPKMTFSDVEIGKTLIESINLSLYKFIKYKTKKDAFEINELNLYIENFTTSRVKSLDRGIEMGNIFSIAVNYARDLVNEPSSTLNPSYLVSEALKIEKSSDNIEVTIYDAKKMKKMGMEASLAIGSGSEEEPKFIKLEYRPKKAFTKIVLVGKGVTFDSGGLSIKPSSSMETMKMDMAGAAAVLAVFKALEKLQINLHVVGLISAVENMPSGSSVRPGDVTKAFNGKTIEILNTDAEGRVTLADSLSYGASLKPKYMIDMATLTGACMIALGEEMSGVMGNSPEMVKQILESGKTENEMSWELPLTEEYKEMLKSDVADLKNTAKRYGGAITAGLFLQEFVEGTPWVHMDIAGPAFYETGSDLIAKGASGIPVKTILRFLLGVR